MEKAPNIWNIGDTYPVIINSTVDDYVFDNEIRNMILIGFNHNIDLETEGKPNVTFMFSEGGEDASGYYDILSGKIIIMVFK